MVGAALGGFVLAMAAADAAPVHLSYNGQVGGHFNDYGPVTAFLPVGSQASLSLTFNDTFSDGSYAFSDNAGPVVGALTVGGLAWVFSDYEPNAYTTDLGGTLQSVSLKFVGTGPAPANAELFGLFIRFTPTLDVLTMSLGFDLVPGPGGFYGYASLTGQGRAVPVAQVPLPGSLALAGLALCIGAATRRPRGRSGRADAEGQQPSRLAAVAPGAG